MTETYTTALLLNIFSFGLFIYFVLSIGFAIYLHGKNKNLDRYTFLALGFTLIIFTLCRPLHIARDDAAYIDISNSICAFDNCGITIQSGRDWLWYIGMALLKMIASNERALMIMAAISLTIKLFIIDRLCKQRILALILLIPLVYIQYDFTQLRAGLAISWYFIGILFLIQCRFWLSGGFMSSNFLLHSQALPSIALLPFAFFNQRKWILPTITILFTSLIYAKFFPSFLLTEKLHAINMGASPYFAKTAHGDYINVKVFPLGYLPMLGYALWLCWGINPQKNSLVRSVGASIALAILLAWFFSFNPTIQTRIFEFYIAPLVLLAGNIGSSKARMIGTIFLALILYLRLELFNNWILG